MNFTRALVAPTSTATRSPTDRVYIASVLLKVKICFSAFPFVYLLFSACSLSSSCLVSTQKKKKKKLKRPNRLYSICPLLKETLDCSKFLRSCHLNGTLCKLNYWCYTLLCCLLVGDDDLKSRTIVVAPVPVRQAMRTPPAPKQSWKTKRPRAATHCKVAWFNVKFELACNKSTWALQ